MKLKNRLQIPLMMAETVITLSLFVLYAGASHRLRIPVGMVLVLAILSLLSVHVILSLWYATAYTTNATSHGAEVKMTAYTTHASSQVTSHGVEVKMTASPPYYNPNEVTVHVGEKVTFKNTDNAPHTATTTSLSYDTGVISPSEEGQLTFTAPGVYSYFSTMDNNMHMHGKIHVLK
jgi:plastocyanin